MNGQTVRALQFSYGSLSETEHQRATVPRHAHELPSFCFVIDGRFRERLREEQAYGKRDVIFRAAGEPHSNVFESETSRCFNVLFDPALLVRAGDHRAPDLRAASAILNRLLRQSRAGANQLVIEGLLLQLVGEVFQPPHIGRSLVAETERIIRERFTEPLTVAGIAGELDVHPVHLSRTYRLEHGTGIAEVIRALRIAYATELLRDDRLSLCEIALQAGFADQSHFTRVFRDVTGQTPGRLRMRR